MNRSTQPSLTRNLSPLVTPFTFGLTTEHQHPFYILTSNPNRHPNPPYPTYPFKLLLMASVEDQHAVVFNDDDLDDEEDDEAQNEVGVDEDDDVDVDEEEEDSTFSPPAPVSNHSGAGQVTIAVVGVPAVTDSLSHEPKQQQINEFGVTPASTIVVEEKRPLPLDDSRKLFQRLWMDEDEIELLQGFLEYTTQRGGINSSSHHHHDTGAFYDQIKNKLQLDFNKNQLVEKLRRLKKKYRTVMSKMGSGKEFVFKSPHDQATFEISRKIWSNAGPIVVRSSGPPPPPPPEDGGFDDDDSHLNLNNANFIDHTPNFNLNPNGIDVKTSKSRKRSRGGAINYIEEKPGFIQQYYQPSGGGTNVIPPLMAAPQAPATAAASTPSLIEETVRSCVSPIFKELLNNLNGSRCFGFGMALGPMAPLGGFGSSAMSSDINMKVDEKWRKQQILELEVYSKRLELVQDQIKAQLEELRSITS